NKGRGVHMKNKTWACRLWIFTLFCLSFGIQNLVPSKVKAQSTGKAAGVPQFKYDAYWPKPLPEGWVLGSVGSVCVDSRDHVFAVTRGAPALKEKGLATPAPPVLEWDADGNLINSWGDRDKMAVVQHGCFIDKEGNFWT